MSTWIKKFIDDTEEYGDDKAIYEGRASWSRGRLEGIKECILTGFGHEVSISLPDTEWHQFDRMEVPVGVGQHKPVRRARILQAKITVEHTSSFIEELLLGSHVEDKYDYYFDKRSYSILEELPANSCLNHTFIEIKQKHLDKWFTIMIDDMGIHISFADKGSF